VLAIEVRQPGTDLRAGRDIRRLYSVVLQAKRGRRPKSDQTLAQAIGDQQRKAARVLPAEPQPAEPEDGDAAVMQALHGTPHEIVNGVLGIGDEGSAVEVGRFRQKQHGMYLPLDE